MVSRLLVIVAAFAVTESSPFPSLDQRKTFSLEDLIPLKLDFFPERVSVHWISETEYLHSDGISGLRIHNVVNGTDSIFIEQKILVNLSTYSILSFSTDRNYALLSSNRKKVYRYSSTAEYAVYDIQKKSVIKLANGQLQAVVWGKDRAIAYVQKNNVFYVPDVLQPDKVVQLTKDGIPEEVYNGITDWIYEEEIFNAAEALWFSKESSHLAVASFNDTNVESAVFPFYGNALEFNNQYPEFIEFKYPKAGRSNPIVGLRVYNMQEPENEPWVIPPPIEYVGPDHILARVNWANDNNLIVFWMNRRQNHSILTNCNMNDHVCENVQSMSEPNGWIDIKDPIFDKSGSNMIITQPLIYADGKRYVHATRFNFKSKETEDLSNQNSTVTDILGWNEEIDTVYYLVAPSSVPWYRHVWASSKGKLKCISCKQPSCHVVGTSFSPGAQYGIFSCSSSLLAPKTFLYDSQKYSYKLIQDNAKLDAKLSEYKMPTVVYKIMSLSENVSAHIKLLLPPDIDREERYPMIVKVYGGPGTSRVKDNFELDYSTYLVSNRSIIVCYIDVRGTGVMGVEALHAINNALGTFEVMDTLAVIRALVKTFKFIDDERIGVWGWSYGGFTTGMMLAMDNMNTLACGAAVAPVTSWLYYDSIYTERYMDTPANNPRGYHQASLVNLAEKLRGRKLLLVHGSGDDNVHYQNSMLLAKRLQHLDIPFEQMSYTDENHSLQGVSRHLYHTLDRFWTDCFE